MMHRGVSLAIVLGTAFAAFAVIAVPACSLLVDTNGLSRNDDAGSAADVSTSADAPSEATPGATVLDASTPDATSNMDAADGDAGFSCPRGSGIFCDDFDHDALGTRWTSADQSYGTLSLSPAAGATGDSRDLRVGLAYVEQSVAFTSRYDNVLCTYGP